MVRKGTHLHKIQSMIFDEAAKAQTYSAECAGNDNTFIQDARKQADAVYDSLSYMISMMGWTEAYNAYRENEKSLTAQALSSK